MVNQKESKQKNGTNTVVIKNTAEIGNFFKGEEIDSLPSQNFANELRQQVLEKYNTYQNENKMEKEKSNGLFNFKNIAILGGGISLLAIGITAFAFFGGVSIFSPATLSSEIAYTEGTVEYRANAESGWLEASKDVILEEGSAIRVLGDGRAIVNLDDGSAVRLGADSQVTLKSMDGDNIAVTNDQGFVYTRVAKLDRKFEVVVDDNVYESLGTAYKTVNTEKEESVNVYESKVAVKVNGEKQAEVNEGEKYYFKSDKNEEKEIIKISEDEIEKDEFISWNKAQDKEIGAELGVLEKTEATSTDKDSEKNEVSEPKTTEETKEEKVAEKTTVKETTPQPAPEPTTSPIGITVSGISPVSGGFNVNWSVSGSNPDKGFKVVYSKNTNPTFGASGTNSLYLSNGGARSASARNLSAGTYYVKVCRYTGSGCEDYSNQVSVTVEGAQAVTGISLTNNGANLSWSTSGGIGQGYKVVWDTTSSPTYPANNHVYVDQNTKSYTINPVKGSGIYYARICAWDGNGGCSTYSNTLEISL